MLKNNNFLKNGNLCLLVALKFNQVNIKEKKCNFDMMIYHRKVTKNE